MQLLIIVLLCIVIIGFLYYRFSNKPETFDNTIRQNNPASPDTCPKQSVYQDTCLTPLVEGDKAHRRFFDSLTYDFPYLKAIN